MIIANKIVVRNIGSALDIVIQNLTVWQEYGYHTNYKASTVGSIKVDLSSSLFQTGYNWFYILGIDIAILHFI